MWRTVESCDLFLAMRQNTGMNVPIHPVQPSPLPHPLPPAALLHPVAVTCPSTHLPHHCRLPSPLVAALLHPVAATCPSTRDSSSCASSRCACCGRGRGETSRYGEEAVPSWPPAHRWGTCKEEEEKGEEEEVAMRRRAWRPPATPTSSWRAKGESAQALKGRACLCASEEAPPSYLFFPLLLSPGPTDPNSSYLAATWSQIQSLVISPLLLLKLHPHPLLPLPHKQR